LAYPLIPSFQISFLTNFGDGHPLIMLSFSTPDHLSFLRDRHSAQHNPVLNIMSGFERFTRKKLVLSDSEFRLTEPPKQLGSSLYIHERLVVRKENRRRAGISRKEQRKWFNNVLF
jgi:hypothetical protein